MTVADYLDKVWMPRMERRAVKPLRLSTVTRYRQLLKQAVPLFGLSKLKDVTPLLVDDIHSKLAKTKVWYGKKALSQRTLLHAHRVLCLAFKHAVRWGLLNSNPFAIAEAPHVADREMRALGDTEARSILNTARGTRLEPFLILALATGARKGELFGLRWSDIDLETGTVAFRRSMNDRAVIGELKTVRSRRTEKVPEEALVALRQLRLIQARTGLELGSPPNKDAAVFAFADGRLWSPHGIEMLWRRLVRDAGLGHVRIHDLRHTAASQLIARGVPITSVSARLGHSKPTTTLAIYSHAMEGGQDIASQAIGELLKVASEDRR